MKHCVQEILDELEKVAPLAYQEDYDNAGLLTGNANMEVANVLLSLDCTEAVVDEAIARGCNVIVCHHPIIFSGLKKLNGNNYVEQTVIKAIKNDIAIIAWHTNLDNVLQQGVNMAMAEKLGLKNAQILEPKNNVLSKLVCFVPENDLSKVSTAMFKAGAGNIGNYTDCGYSLQGEGSFTPKMGANPVIGKINEQSKVKEIRFETLVPNFLINQVVNEMKKAHHYEEVAFEIYPILNKNQEIGAGIIGELTTPLSPNNFLKMVKEKLNLPLIKYTQNNNRNIKKVAFCGGSGSFLIKRAKQQKADAYITSDIKYHEFFDSENQLLLCDIGHYESEIHVLEIFNAILSKKFTKFATLFTDTNTNPVAYYI